MNIFKHARHIIYIYIYICILTHICKHNVVGIDEGKGGVISNPVFSAVLCLSGDLAQEHSKDEDFRLDSPTLVTKMNREDEGIIDCTLSFLEGE